MYFLSIHNYNNSIQQQILQNKLEDLDKEFHSGPYCSTREHGFLNESL